MLVSANHGERVSPTWQIQIRYIAQSVLDDCTAIGSCRHVLSDTSAFPYAANTSGDLGLSPRSETMVIIAETEASSAALVPSRLGSSLRRPP